MTSSLAATTAIAKPTSSTTTTTTTTTSTTTTLATIITPRAAVATENEGDDGDYDGAEARIRRMLEDAVSPRKKSKMSWSYRDRLESFSTLTYFGKPVAISPIVCAALGWRNIGNDLLECTYCKSKLCILIDPKTSVSSLKQLVKNYQNQLSYKGHVLGCWFATATMTTTTTTKRMAKSTMIEAVPLSDDSHGTTTNTPTSTTTTTTLPMYLSSVLDPEFVMLFEHPTPSKLLLERMTELQLQQQQENNNDNINNNDITLSKEVPELENIKDDNDVLKQVCIKMGLDHDKDDDDDDDDNNDDDDDATLQKKYHFMQVLFGWDIISKTSNSLSSTLSCRVCLACLGKCSSSSVLLIQSSHKYYCPYRCGIISFETHHYDEEEPSVPSWRIVCSRILAEPTRNVAYDNNEGAEAAMARIRVMLRESS